jgi:hypothetical protein
LTTPKAVAGGNNYVRIRTKQLAHRQFEMIFFVVTVLEFTNTLTLRFPDNFGTACSFIKRE